MKETGGSLWYRVRLQATGKESATPFFGGHRLQYRTVGQYRLEVASFSDEVSGEDERDLRPAAILGRDHRLLPQIADRKYELNVGQSVEASCENEMAQSVHRPMGLQERAPHL